MKHIKLSTVGKKGSKTKSFNNENDKVISEREKESKQVQKRVFKMINEKKLTIYRNKINKNDVYFSNYSKKNTEMYEMESSLYFNFWIKSTDKEDRKTLERANFNGDFTPKWFEKL